MLVNLSGKNILPALEFTLDYSRKFMKQIKLKILNLFSVIAPNNLQLL